jgi:hypothetical protein
MYKHLTEHHCLNCKHKLNASDTLEDDRDAPEPGCFTVCMYCSHLMVFADDMSVREPTDAEIVAVAGHGELLQMMAVLAEYRRRKETGEL